MANVLGFWNMGSVQLFDKNVEDNLLRYIVAQHILNTSKQMGSLLFHIKCFNVFLDTQVSLAPTHVSKSVRP